MGKLMWFKVNEFCLYYLTYSSVYVREGTMELMGIKYSQAEYADCRRGGLEWRIKNCGGDFG